MTDEIQEKIDWILGLGDNGLIRKMLNSLERAFPQQVFIKTHLCSCGKMKVEIWKKVKEVDLL